MGQDISAELSGLIANAEVFGSSENIRHGKYKFIIKNIRAEMVEVEKGKHKYVFWELEPYEALPNPQIEGDRVDYAGPTQPGAGPLKDDGTKPNMVGSNCALKIDFDGPGGRSAPANAQAPILALFNKQAGQLSKEELAATWEDLSRQKDVRKGEPIGFDASTKQVILADKDKRAQPARGMVIGCTTLTKKKKDPNEKGAYITKLQWYCISPIGTGENASDKVAERRAKIEANQPDDEEDTTTAPTNGAQTHAGMPQMPVGVTSAPPPGGVQVPATPPQMSPPAPPAPPSPPALPVAFSPPAPWRLHPDPQYHGATPETRWYWDGASAVKSEAQLRSGQ